MRTMQKPPILICSKNQRCLPVLLQSIDLYVPEDVEIYICGGNTTLPRHKTHLLEHKYDKGGEAWNFITNKAFESHEEAVACADDVVLNPDSYQQLMEDVELLKEFDPYIATVAARTNYAKGLQNIRYGQGNLIGLNYEGEGQIVKTDYIAGIFHWIAKNTWEEVLPIDWYSDDIWCMNQLKKNHGIYISRSYVHHVGSQTLGRNHAENDQISKEWLLQNKPEIYKNLFG